MVDMKEISRPEILAGLIGFRAMDSMAGASKEAASR